MEHKNCKEQIASGFGKKMKNWEKLKQMEKLHGMEVANMYYDMILDFWKVPNRWSDGDFRKVEVW